jgi:hypothetical protein
MPAEPDHALLFAADCPVCGRGGTVVTPDYCSDGHGAECPDRICVDCGSALFVDPDVGSRDASRSQIA